MRFLNQLLGLGISSKYRVEVRRKGKARAWYWRIVHSNGKTLAHSESYSSRAKATKSASEFATHGECLGVRVIDAR